MTKLIACSVLALTVAAFGCSSLTIVGVSGEGGAKGDTPPAAAAPRTATEVDAISGELLMPLDLVLGDVDGDGYDDFLLSGSQVAGYDRYGRIPNTEASATAYLFYGRTAFAEHLVSTDADATFETGLTVSSFALGDINGDGLADFVLEDRDGYEIIFGARQRWTGHHAKLSAQRPNQPTSDTSINRLG